MLRWNRQLQKLLSLRDFVKPAHSWEPAATLVSPVPTELPLRCSFHAGSAAFREYIALNNLSDNPGATKVVSYCRQLSSCACGSVMPGSRGDLGIVAAGETAW